MLGDSRRPLELKKKVPRVRQEGIILKVAKGLVLEAKEQEIIIS